MSTEQAPGRQGWGFPPNSRKAHYFVLGSTLSICGRWWFLGRREDNNHGSPDNCAACKRKRAREVTNGT